MNVKFNITSLDRKDHMVIDASTTQRVTGDLKPIDWHKYAKNWTHLRGLQFPCLGRKPKVDLPIGLDYAELLRSIGERSVEEG